MRETLGATVENGQLKWQGIPPSLPDGTQVRIVVLPQFPDADNVAVAKQALERLVKRGTVCHSIPDPSAWQREQRKDRPLPWKRKDGNN